MYGFLHFMLAHFVTAFLFYLNHRYVFHGKWGKTGLLASWKLVHTRHHKVDYGPNFKKYALIPWWGWLAVVLVCSTIALLSNNYVGGGVFSYFLAYELRHYRLHAKLDGSDRLTRFHYYHHRKSAKKNFATMWTFIDRLFGTYHAY